MRTSFPVHRRIIFKHAAGILTAHLKCLFQVREIKNYDRYTELAQ